MMSLAGVEGQRIYRPTSIRNCHASSDYQHVTELLSSFVVTDRSLEAWVRYLRFRVANLLEFPAWWFAVVYLANVLLERRPLSGAETMAVIRAALARYPART